MKAIIKTALSPVLAGALALAFAGPVMANLVNGSFESGDFTGWGTYNSDGMLTVDDGIPAGLCAEQLLPSDGITDGDYAAYFDMDGPNTIAIWQDFVVPDNGALSLSLTYRNESEWSWLGVLDHTGEANQHLRIDIMDPAAPDLSMEPADIYLTVFETDEASPNSADRLPVTADLSAWAGQTVRLRIAKVDNTGCFPTAVDNVLAGAEAGIANFKVTKLFTEEGRNDEVEVTLTCNSGLPLTQSFTIAGGDEDGVTFVVTELPEDGANCEVTESGGPDNYTPVMNGGLGCKWSSVRGGLRVCEIVNVPDPAKYTVEKDWVVPDQGFEEMDYLVEVTVTCESDITMVGSSSYSYGSYWSGVLGDGDAVTLTVDTSEGATSCSAEESITQSGVEGTSSAACGGASLDAGDSATCTFTNTVFFEGIPTLSQYGLAVLALLMLGVGFVGMRRFI